MKEYMLDLNNARFGDRFITALKEVMIYWYSEKDINGVTIHYMAKLTHEKTPGLGHRGEVFGYCYDGRFISDCTSGEHNIVTKIDMPDGELMIPPQPEKLRLAWRGTWDKDNWNPARYDSLRAAHMGDLYVMQDGSVAMYWYFLKEDDYDPTYGHTSDCPGYLECDKHIFMYFDGGKFACNNWGHFVEGNAQSRRAHDVMYRYTGE